jgi:hypothetical protein
MWVLGGLLSAWLTPCKTCYTEYRKSLQCFALIMSVQGVTRGYKDGLQPETLADGTDNECKGSGRSCASATLQSIHFKRTSSTHTTHIHNTHRHAQHTQTHTTHIHNTHRHTQTHTHRHTQHTYTHSGTALLCARACLSS